MLITKSHNIVRRILIKKYISYLNDTIYYANINYIAILLRAILYYFLFYIRDN